MEMKIFARPEIIGGNNDVDKQLSKLQRPTIEELYKFYMKIFEVNSKEVEDSVASVVENIKKLEFGLRNFRPNTMLSRSRSSA
jgi:hypothetical protein